MKRYELKKEYGPSGPAMVTVGPRAVGVLMQETHIKYELPHDSVPEFLVEGGFKNGLLRVSFSDDNTRLLNASPWEGRVLAKVKNFGGDDFLPTPKQDKSDGHTRDGRTYPRDFLKWGATIELTGPKEFVGMSAYCPFLYYDKKRGGFIPDESGTMVALAGKNRDIQRLELFLQATGVGELELPWSDNILPALLAAIKKKDREFAVHFKDGWPDTYEAIIQKVVERKPKAKKK